MVRKCIQYIALFAIIALVNFYLISRYYGMTKKQQNVQRILAEISHIRASTNQSQFQYSASPFVLGVYQAEAGLGDSRAANLKVFFRKYNSPLYDYADSIVRVSDENSFDYRLLPAIAMQESNLCHYIPDDSHNCWGWGIYGSTVTKFESYDDAIQTVGKGIKKEYIDKGLLTASAIMEKYTPMSNGSWAHGVNTFLKALE